MSSTHWSKGLLQAIIDPACLVISTKDLVAIRDKFPKAKYHFLIVPLVDIDSIFDVSTEQWAAISKLHRVPIPIQFLHIITYFHLFGNIQLTRDDVNMLREMEHLAQNAIEVTGRSINEFKIGYHAKPSMQRVHLHVISRDFHSPCLKTKKHWNSFNTPFLLSSECRWHLCPVGCMPLPDWFQLLQM